MRALTVALALLAASSFAPSRAHALTVDEAVRQALASAQGNIRERVTREQAAAASDQALSIGANMLFKLHVSEEWQHYNCPFAISFATFGGGCLADVQKAAAGTPLPAGLPAAFAMPVTVRNQNTNTLVVSADQPILGLLRLSHEYLAQKRAAKALLEGVTATDQRLVESVRNGFLRVYEAIAAEDVAKSSETELTEQVRVAQSREKAGVITVADMLRVQVALANAHQQRVQAHAQAQIARSTLLDAIGMNAEDESTQLEEPSQLLELAAHDVPERGAATQNALARRPEVKQAMQQYDSAVADRRSRIFAMLPDADLEGAYQRFDGQLFAQKNSWFVGVKAQWTFWEWGAGYFAQRAAKHQQNAAMLSLDDQKRQVVLEVRNAFSNLDAASAAVVAAKEAIDSANEAYRVTAKSVEAGTATTTDLLNAQSELTTARLNLTRSRYEQAMSRVTLMRLTGE